MKNRMKKNKEKRHSKSFIDGFTIVELVVTFVIVALLLGIGIISYSTIFQSSINSYYHTLESSLMLSGSDYFENHRELLSVNEDSGHMITATLNDGNAYVSVTTRMNYYYILIGMFWVK